MRQKNVKMFYRFFRSFSETDCALLGFPLSKELLGGLQRLLVVPRRPGRLLAARLKDQEVVDVKGWGPRGVRRSGSVKKETKRMVLEHNYYARIMN